MAGDLKRTAKRRTIEELIRRGLLGIRATLVLFRHKLIELRSVPCPTEPIEKPLELSLIFLKPAQSFASILIESRVATRSPAPPCVTSATDAMKKHPVTATL
jgi:hypothetical protein